MSAIWTIALGAVKEHSRRRLLLAFGLIMLLIYAIIMYFALSNNQTEILFGVGPRSQLARGPSTQFIVGVGVFVALAVSMGNVGGLFASGEALLVLSRPVSRVQYSLGRIVGSILVTTGFCAVSFVMSQLISQIDARIFDADIAEFWGLQVFNLAVLVILTTLLSSFLKIPFVAAIISYLVNSVLGGIEFAYLLTGELIGGGLATAIKVLYWITPKTFTSELDERTLQESIDQLAGREDVAVSFADGFGKSVVAFAYLVTMVLLNLVIVRRKEV